MKKIMFMPTGNVFELPDDVADELYDKDMNNYKFVLEENEINKEDNIDNAQEKKKKDSTKSNKTRNRVQSKNKVKA